MFELNGVELVGYLASALVVLAVTMTSVVRLRILSLCGSITFFVYGTLINSVPIMITNVVIAFINVWFLRKEFASGRSGGVELGASHIRPDSPYLRDFISYHSSDINRFQPDFELPTGDDATAWMLTRDGLPAGFLIGRRSGTMLRIDLDYVLPPYRDSRLGCWLYGPGADVFRRDGITTVYSEEATPDHRKYLERMGFRSESDVPGTLQLSL